eukprot:gene7890-16153_t
MASSTESLEERFARLSANIQKSNATSSKVRNASPIAITSTSLRGPSPSRATSFAGLPSSSTIPVGLYSRTQTQISDTASDGSVDSNGNEKEKSDPHPIDNKGVEEISTNIKNNVIPNRSASRLSQSPLPVRIASLPDSPKNETSDRVMTLEEKLSRISGSLAVVPPPMKRTASSTSSSDLLGIADHKEAKAQEVVSQLQIPRMGSFDGGVGVGVGSASPTMSVTARKVSAPSPSRYSGAMDQLAAMQSSPGDDSMADPPLLYPVATRSRPEPVVPVLNEQSQSLTSFTITTHIPPLPSSTSTSTRTEEAKSFPVPIPVRAASATDLLMSQSSEDQQDGGMKVRKTITGGGRAKATPPPPPREVPLIVPSGSGGLVTGFSTDPSRPGRVYSPFEDVKYTPAGMSSSNGGGAAGTAAITERSISAGPKERLPKRGSDSPVKFAPQHRRMPEPSAAVTKLLGRSPEQPTTRVSFGNWSLSRRDNRGLDDSNSFEVERDEKRTVRVAVRVRPFTIGEIQSGSRRVVSVNGEKLILVNPHAFEADPDTIAAAAAAVSLENMRCGDWAKVFKFDQCFWSYDPNDEGDTYADQMGIYENVGTNIVADAIRGRSSSCFAYGHTGTGKTHSMFGSVISSAKGTGSGATSSNNDNLSAELTDDAGLIPRVFSDIINFILNDPDMSADTTMTLSFMEVYNEKIRDLLSVKTEGEAPLDLKVREHPEIGPYVEHLTKIEVRSAVEARKLLFAGHIERATAQTNSNIQSSRSHAVVTLELAPLGFDVFQQPAKHANRMNIKPAVVSSTVTRSRTKSLVRIQMVDLAGSERELSTSSTKDDDDDHSNNRAVSRRNSSDMRTTANSKENKHNEKIESKMIRRSLSTLGYIIKALGRGVSAKGLPYRDSVLTWILKDALGGHSCHTTMLATVSPSHLSYDETLSTLKYADRLCVLGGHGRGGDSPGRVAIGDTIDPQLSLTLTTEFNRLKKELGGQKTGSKASRMLLQQTISDPQQRLARLDAQGREGRHHLAIEDYNDSKRYPDSLVAASGSDLREQFRMLHNQQIELQIELEATRTDRDSLRIELQNLRESSAYSSFDGRRPTAGGRSAIFELSEALKQSEREVNELRSMLSRKDQDMEQLVNELAEERQARSTIEKTTRVQSADLITRMEALQRQVQVATQEMHRSQADSIQSQRERDAIGEEVKVIRKAMIHEKQQHEAHTKEMETLLRQSHEALRSYQEAMKQPQEAWKQSQEALKQAQETIRHLQESMRHSQDELRKNQDDLILTTRERNDSRAQVEAAEREKVQQALRETSLRTKIEEVTREARVQLLTAQQLMDSRLKSEVDVLTTERDNLSALVRQQEQALNMQQQQAQTSMKMLYQRQAALADLEHRSVASNGADELQHLQDMLHNVLSREGDVLQGEVADARRLTGMISALRDKLQSVNILHDNLAAERSLRQDLEDQNMDLRTALQRGGGGNGSGGSSVDKLMQEIEFLKKKAAEGEANAQYWQQLAKKTGVVAGVPVPAAQETMLREENIDLREQLEAAKQDAIRSKQELEVAKEDMQREFASLWLAVQQLNKMDAVKETNLRDLASERDKVAAEKRDITVKYEALSEEHKSLQKELQDIDLELLDYIDAEGIPIEQLPVRTGPLLQLRKEIPRDKRSPTRISRHVAPTKSTATNATTSHHNTSPTGTQNQNQNQQTSTTPTRQRSPYGAADRNAAGTNRRTQGGSDSRGLHQGMEQQVQELSHFLEKDRERVEIQQNRMRKRVSASSNRR